MESKVKRKLIDWIKFWNGDKTKAVEYTIKAFYFSERYNDARSKDNSQKAKELLTRWLKMINKLK